MIENIERSRRLHELLDDDFLIKLLEVAKLTGWEYYTDFTEVQEFVRIMYDVAGKDEPDVSEYEIDHEN